ncbi:hypothetical protein LQ953_13860 [Sphingomonas sp. IC-56]|uniref:hypothetical protein n=1 Tax=Sphingomonas sp. IC-56 TaxID=2898529 RepID=UPI001E323912|nr:hypothetical protein [Sphingomonas sp. IC-56]MCD2325103.1 hypothetical protein [Sphingomonas sp. IC-56]
MKQLLWMAGAALALAGCQETDEPAAPANASANWTANASGEDIGQRVAALSDRERNVVFIRAILDAKLPCQAVKTSQRMEDQDGRPLWRANCSGGGSHMITITPDGTANIVSRSDR